MKQKFTLVELLVVVAIIAILASMLLPALNKVRETAKRIKCVGKMKQIATAVIMYAQDYEGHGPAGTNIGNYLFVSNTNGGIGDYLGVSKKNLIGYPNFGIMPQISICESGARYGTANPNFLEAPANGRMNNSYALNHYLCRDYSGNLKNVKNPTGRMLLATSGIDGWNNLAYSGGGYVYDRSQMAFRHQRNGNFAFVDGHAATSGRNDVPFAGYAVYDQTTMFWKQDY